MKRKAPDAFPTEAALCQAFIDDIKTQRGWIVYPETAGFDILLVREDTGHQLGIEAKLRLNEKVIDQILPSEWADCYHGGEGPDWRGVLVPEGGGSIARLLTWAGVMIFAPRRDFGRRLDGTYGEIWRFDILGRDRRYGNTPEWHDWNPAKRCTLPEIVPTVAAGVPAPIQLTPWKIGALKVLAILELDGCVTRKEVQACGCHPSRWCATDGWLEPLGGARWARGRVPPFDQQHPAEYAEILAKMREKRAAVPA